MKKLSFKEYIIKVTPEGGVFSESRVELGVSNNIVKWISLRFSYLFYLLRLTPNVLDVLAILFLLVAYFLFLNGFLFNNNNVYYGWLMISFHVAIDFMDGAIARARYIKSPIGDAMDNIGLDVSRILFLLVIGVLSNNQYFEILNVFSGLIAINLFYNTAKDILVESKYINFSKKITGGRYSPLGIRIILGILPMLMVVLFFYNFNMSKLCFYLSLIYFCLALNWLIICMGKYEKNKF